MLTLITPLFGFSLSLKWFIPDPKAGNEKPSVALEDESIAQEMTTTWPKSSPLTEAAATDNPTATIESALYYDIEPVNGHVHVALRGDVADDMKFTLDGTKVDALSVVQTWQGENVHQFLIKTDQKARLGVFVGTE
jgi:hypothetical protein